MTNKLSDSLYHKTLRAWTVFIIILLYTNSAQSQVFYHVQHTTGTATYGNTAVTVVPDSIATFVNNACIGTGTHYVTKISPTAARSYTFNLSVPTSHIRIKMMSTASTTGSVHSFKVNGQNYILGAGNLSALPILGSGCIYCIDMILYGNGKIADTVLATPNKHGCIQIDIVQPNIQSFTIRMDSILGLNSQANSSLGVFFLEDTTSFIKQPFTDTVKCPGDSLALVYTTNFRFQNNNSFTAQLSNASGSFATPVNIGSHADTTGDTIKCVIPTNTPAGNGYRIRIVSSNPADTSLDNQVNIRVKGTVANFNNTSNTPVCTIDSLQLTGSSTSTGVTWSWTGPNSFTSNAEDTFISNSAMNHAGDYILKATLNSTGCSLKDTTTVVMKPTPDKPTAGSNGPVCETKSLQLTVGSTTSGVSWGWSGPGSYSSTTQNPTVTGSATSTHAGDYISTATLNGCSSKDTVNVVVLPKPAKPTPAAPNSPLCVKQDLQLTATSITGANYTWLGPSSFNANTQNPVRPYVQFNHAGNYYVYATVNGCISDTDSVAVVVNTDPVVNIFPTPGTTICPGQQATFTALPTNGGTAPTYQWRVNGIATGGTSVSYNTTTINNGDIVTCHMTSTTTCSTPFTDTSNAISMTVLPKMTPSVTISANPNTSLHPNEPITFTATPTNAGATPIYQWRRNGKNVTGATSATWGANANALGDGDEICVWMRSSYQCPDPDTVLSNCIKLDIRLGVISVASENGGIKVYPNPMNDVLHIDGVSDNSKVELYDVVGRKVYHATATGDSHTINTANFAQGNYLLKITDKDGNRIINKVVKE